MPQPLQNRNTMFFKNISFPAGILLEWEILQDKGRHHAHRTCITTKISANYFWIQIMKAADITPLQPLVWGMWAWVNYERNEVERLLSLWEIGGYKIYVGSHKNQLGLALRITDAQVTKASLTNLPSGLNYIAVAAYDVNGVESRPSNTQAFAVP